jgi:hypothetical protein
VYERLQRFSPITSYTQEFTAWFTQTLNISLVIDNVPMTVSTFSGTVSTPSSAILKAPLQFIPQNGCSSADYAGVDATAKIVLVKRGVCTFASKVVLAKAQGAAAALIWNNVNGTPSGGNLGKGDFVAAGMISMGDGSKLVQRLEKGEVIEVEFLVDAIGEERKTWNVIAETKDGDPENVVVVGFVSTHFLAPLIGRQLGAHLDGVQAGPGINDDGSGSSALLELIEAVKHYRVNNKVRFIWWGAEENGLLGSFHYTETLPASEVEKIAMYLNFDMIGSKNAFYGVFDGDGSTYGFFPAPGSGHIEKRFVDYLTSKGKVVQPAAFSNGSDYVGFVGLGVPVGGLFTGTIPQDVCYHLKCDDLDNINWEVLTLNTKVGFGRCGIKIGLMDTGGCTCCCWLCGQFGGNPR